MGFQIGTLNIAVPGTIIASAPYNSNFNQVKTKYNGHDAADTLVHNIGFGLYAGSDVVGTLEPQTLLNKTLDGASFLNGIKIYNPAGTFYYNVLGSAILANYDVTLPLISANDAFVLASASQAVANKTITASTFSGSVTVPSGQSLTMSAGSTLNLQDNTIAPSKLTNIAQYNFLSRSTAGTGAVEVVSRGTVGGYLSSQIDHSQLQNLTTGDPHTQYPLASGSEMITGAWGIYSHWTFVEAPRIPGDDPPTHASDVSQKGMAKAWAEFDIAGGVSISFGSNYNIETGFAIVGSNICTIFFDEPFTSTGYATVYGGYDSTGSVQPVGTRAKAVNYVQFSKAGGPELDDYAIDGNNMSLVVFGNLDI